MITFLVRLKSDKEDEAELRKIFTGLDTDHDGFLAQDEISKAMSSFSTRQSSFADLKELDWKQIIKKCDTDGDGKVSYEEFFTAASDRTKVLNKEYLKQAFDLMDLDGNGKIDKNEIKACFTKGKLGELDT